ncbi:Piso0_005437 [Millerozyma farinosa CBS 7064]|uniref:Piso0_005437 protein n=1 Tax=Pichia sorbitophila (strain ATCC MYA-4447 / BCRC 22081 / CBS 7064 / NBRC 10061 / NRRL Y-12695) TaxID=559304 RepID=G8Y535_PICSO|nr:Piso0_005437 [Millerozyma farinosa CBS 7064]
MSLDLKPSVELVQNASVDDENLKSAELPESLQGLTEEELEKLSKRTVRKLDIRIFPMVVLIYILNYLDRNNIASARLGGLEDDLNLKGSQYETCISILFVGYILMQIPSNMLMHKLGKPSIFLAIIMTSWGIISTCTGAVQGFGGLFAVRFLLGFVEAGFFGSCLYYLSCWYSRKELGVRNAVLYSGSLVSGAWSGLIAAGIIDNMKDVRGLNSWRWLFIIEGSITVFIVPFALLILPDMPHNTKFLSQQEKDIIMWKLKAEVGQNDSDNESQENHRGALLLVAKDVKAWLVTICFSFLVAACGVTNFFPSVVETLNFNRVTTLCLTAPPYCIAVVATFFWARHADKTGERYWHVVIPLIGALISFIISASTLNTAARYFAMCIMIPTLYCAFTTILSWMSNCIPRPPMKRAIAIGLMNCIGNSTSIWNSYLYPSSQGPQYLVAFVCNCAFILCSIAAATILRFRLAKLNRKIIAGTMDWEKELGSGNDGSKIAPDFRFLV